MKKSKSFYIDRPSERHVDLNWVALWKLTCQNVFWDRVSYENYFSYYDDHLIRRKPTDVILNGSGSLKRLYDLLERGYKVYQIIPGKIPIIRLVKVESRSWLSKALHPDFGDEYQGIEHELLYDNRSIANLTKAQATHLHSVATQHKVVASKEEEEVMNAMLNQVKERTKMRAEGKTVFQDHEMQGRQKCAQCNQPVSEGRSCYWHAKQAQNLEAGKKPQYPWEDGYVFGDGDTRPSKPSDMGIEALIEMGVLDRSVKPFRKAESTCKHGLRPFECGVCKGHKPWKDPFGETEREAGVIPVDKFFDIQEQLMFMNYYFDEKE